ncbi:MAG: 7-cyano-7-deazaguanine synthase QueC [Gemmataceae bacterium]
MPRAVILLSGGLDSATTLAVASRDGFDCHCLSVDYGQRHKIELEFAVRQAKLQHAAEHRMVAVDLRSIGGSALTADIVVPKDQLSGGRIPITYVPARNTVMLSLLLGYAEVVGAFDLFIGANAVDYSGYPDCRPEYLQAFETMANLATKAAVEGVGHYAVHAPLVSLTKAEIIRLGMQLGVDYSQTVSCYDPDASGRACGHCDSCILRKNGFAASGVADPTRYI